MNFQTILDNDTSGNELYNKIFTNNYNRERNKLVLAQKNNSSIGILLQSENTEEYKLQIEHKYIPIELLYSRTALDAFNNTHNCDFWGKIECFGEVQQHYSGANKITGLTDCFYIKGNIKLKKAFCDEIKEFEKEKFEGFKKTLNIVVLVIKNFMSQKD